MYWDIVIPFIASFEQSDICLKSDEMPFLSDASFSVFHPPRHLPQHVATFEIPPLILVAISRRLCFLYIHVFHL